MDELGSLIKLLDGIVNKYRRLHPKLGHPYTYGEVGMLLFLIAVHIKKIPSWSGMANYVKSHYKEFGFPSAPCRQTIKRRFLGISYFLIKFIPFLAMEVEKLDERFCLKMVGFIDKSLFYANGDVWHKKQMKEAIVPNKNIDTEAHWGKSQYQGWVFGYGLHLLVNKFRFPFSAQLDAANIKEKTYVETMIHPIRKILLFLVGDNGYRIISLIKKVYMDYSIFIITPKPYKTKGKFKNWYSMIIQAPFIRKIYALRRSSIEPTFSLIKELFELTGKSQLPYKGKRKVASFLLLATGTIQLMMIYNSINNLNLCQINTFKNICL